MSLSNPLDTLIDLARKSRDGAGKSLADEQRQSQQTATQLETLKHYRQEYASQMQTMLQSGTDAAILSNFRAFLLSLDSAIERAGHTLEQQQHRVDSSRVHWQQQQRRLSSYDTLVDRRAAHERRRGRRLELLQNDEFTSNNSARARQRSDQ